MPTNTVTDETRVINLLLELKAAEKEKKEAMKMLKENIVRLKEEIAAIVNNQPEDAEETSTN